MHEGQCLCGAVAYTVTQQMTDPLACHCKQCRQQSGHYVAAGHARKDAVVFHRDDGLVWYRASASAMRGFCRTCGSSLFWRGDTGDGMAVLLGPIKGATGLKLGRHCWVNAKGDYYDINDGLAQSTGVEA